MVAICATSLLTVRVPFTSKTDLLPLPLALAGHIQLHTAVLVSHQIQPAGRTRCPIGRALARHRHSCRAWPRWSAHPLRWKRHISRADCPNPRIRHCQCQTVETPETMSLRLPHVRARDQNRAALQLRRRGIPRCSSTRSGEHHARSSGRRIEAPRAAARIYRLCSSARTCVLRSSRNVPSRQAFVHQWPFVFSRRGPVAHRQIGMLLTHLLFSKEPHGIQSVFALWMARSPSFS